MTETLIAPGVPDRYSVRHLPKKRKRAPLLTPRGVEGRYPSLSPRGAGEAPRARAAAASLHRFRLHPLSEDGDRAISCFARSRDPARSAITLRNLWPCRLPVRSVRFDCLGGHRLRSSFAADGLDICWELRGLRPTQYGQGPAWWIQEFAGTSRTRRVRHSARPRPQPRCNEGCRSSRLYPAA